MKLGCALLQVTWLLGWEHCATQISASRAALLQVEKAVVTWTQLGSLAPQMNWVGSATAGLAAELLAQGRHGVLMLAWVAWEGSLRAVVGHEPAQQGSLPWLEVVDLHSSLTICG